MSPQTPPIRGAFDRRTALKAAAWTTPVIALAAAAPARAASTSVVPGLNGWITFGREETGGIFGRGYRTTLDARGQYPDRGLWVNDVTAKTTLTDIHIVFHLAQGAGTPTFTKSGSGPWTNLTRVGTITIGRQTYTSYRADFTGTPTLSGGRAYVNNDFKYTSSTISESNPTRYIDRFVTIDGKIYSFRRLVGGTGEVLPTTPYSAARMAALPEAAQSADLSLEDGVEVTLLQEDVA